MLAAIVQARMGSTRLPNKTLMPAVGKPLILHLLERLKHSELLEGIILATTVESEDDILAKVVEENGYWVFRGSEADVLDRYYQAAKQFSVDPIIRITGDCPLIDPTVVDKVITQFRSGRFDHVGNGIPPSYPDGLDAEIFSFAALEAAWKNARLPSEREHVSSYIWNRKKEFRYGNVRNAVDLSSLRWTLDYREDYELIKAIFEGLYQDGKVFLMQDVLKFLVQHPEIAQLNSRYTRNEGYTKSLKEDVLFQKRHV